MRQWSDLLLREILGWPNVSSRPMFGMTAVYRGKAIFGVLPRTRAMATPQFQDSIAESEPEETVGSRPSYPANCPRREMDFV